MENQHLQLHARPQEHASSATSNYSAGSVAATSGCHAPAPPATMQSAQSSASTSIFTYNARTGQRLALPASRTANLLPCSSSVSYSAVGSRPTAPEMAPPHARPAVRSPAAVSAHQAQFEHNLLRQLPATSSSIHPPPPPPIPSSLHSQEAHAASDRPTHATSTTDPRQPPSETSSLRNGASDADAYTSRKPALSKVDIGNLSFDLSPSKLEDWIAYLTETLEDVSELAADLISMPEQQYHACIADPEILSWDRWAARQVCGVLNKDAPRVKAFLATINKQCPHARRSVRTLIAEMRKSVVPVSETAAQNLLQKFKSKTYFKLSMDEPAILLAASELESEFNALPPHLSAGPHRLLREMRKC